MLLLRDTEKVKARKPNICISSVIVLCKSSSLKLWHLSHVLCIVHWVKSLRSFLGIYEPFQVSEEMVSIWYSEIWKDKAAFNGHLIFVTLVHQELMEGSKVPVPHCRVVFIGPGILYCTFPLHLGLLFYWQFVFYAFYV